LVLFDWAIGLLQSLLTFFYNGTDSIGIASYGIAIILLTLTIKLVLYPLTVKQVKGMKAMQELQPQMKELQEKYKGNPEKLNKEMALLYKESGANPLAGCLPLIVQMPILMGIFYAIRDYQYAPEHLTSFLWVPNLSMPDPLYILPIISAATTYIQQKQTSTDMNQQTKMMMNIMPIFIGYISLKFPAGLVLYWVVSNVFQIAQQWWMYRGAPQK
jgi:YidC/Oxa1 family membrane protein insertase